MANEKSTSKHASIPSGYADEGEFEWGLTARTERSFRAISKAMVLSKIGRKSRPGAIGEPTSNPANTAASRLRGSPKTVIVLSKAPGTKRHQCLLPAEEWDSHFSLLESVCGSLDEAALLSERAMLRLTTVEAIEYLTPAEFLNLEIESGTVSEYEVDIGDLETTAGELVRGVECTELVVGVDGSPTFRLVAQYQRWALAVALALVQHGNSGASSFR